MFPSRSGSVTAGTGAIVSFPAIISLAVPAGNEGSGRRPGIRALRSADRGPASAGSAPQPAMHASTSTPGAKPVIHRGQARSATATS